MTTARLIGRRAAATAGILAVVAFLLLFTWALAHLISG